MALSASHWRIGSSPTRPTVLEIAYGRDAHFPQIAALHTRSSYLRLTGGSGTTWGTSVVILPVVWQAGHVGPTQGAPLRIIAWTEERETLVLDFTGRIAGLSVTGKLCFFPPATDCCQVDVAISVRGDTKLHAAHTHEAFKTVMLSSMHVASDLWDTERALVDGKRIAIPAPPQWIVPPSLDCQTFGLQGGRSQWQQGHVAPTLAVSSSEHLSVAGWISSPGLGRRGGPNSDNVALWAAQPRVPSAWRYTITARV